MSVWLHPKRFERFFANAYPRGIRLARDADVPSVAQDIHARATAHNITKQLPSVDKVVHGLQRWIRLEQFRTAFQETSVTVDRTAMHRILSGSLMESDRQGWIWQREDVISLEEASAGVIRFIQSYLGVTPAQGSDIHIPAFYVLGPTKSVQIGTPDNPLTAHAAFPNVNVPEGEIYFIKPVFDNLVGLQFRVLDRQDRILRRYAFDKSVAALFSDYDYAEEEERQFRIFNEGLLSPSERQAQAECMVFLRSALAVWWARSEGDNRLELRVPNCTKVKIVGPMRRLRLCIKSMHPNATAAERIFVLNHLHLEPGETWTIKVLVDFSSSKGPGGIWISFSPINSTKKSRGLYLDAVEGNFIQTASGTMDSKGRVVLPEQFHPRVWDDNDATLTL